MANQNLHAITEWQQDRQEQMQRNDWLRYAGLMPTNQQAFYTREELLNK